ALSPSSSDFRGPQIDESTVRVLPGRELTRLARSGYRLGTGPCRRSAGDRSRLSRREFCEGEPRVSPWKVLELTNPPRPPGILCAPSAEFYGFGACRNPE